MSLTCCALQDGVLRVWRAGAADAHVPFNLHTVARLSGHRGPVTTVAVDETCAWPEEPERQRELLNRGALCFATGTVALPVFAWEHI